MTAAETVSATQSVLDQMTASVMGVKADKKAQLTPVGTEQRAATALPRVPSASFPNDEPAEAIQQRIYAIREQMTFIEQALIAVEGHLGAVQAVVTDPVATQKAREQAADARQAALNGQVASDDEAAYDAAVSTDLAASVAAASARLDATSAAAKAAVFPAKDPIGQGWTCPLHGDAVVAKSKKGREYRRCPLPDCVEFERL